MRNVLVKHAFVFRRHFGENLGEIVDLSSYKLWQHLTKKHCSMSINMWTFKMAFTAIQLII